MLKQVHFFSHLSEDQFQTVAGLMRPVDYSAGDFIFRQGSAPDGMYLVESGKVLLWCKVADTRMDMVTCGPGQIVCESALVERAGRLTNAEATVPSRVWVLDARAFGSIQAQNHPAASAILVAATRGLSSTFRGALAHFGRRFGDPPDNSTRPAPGDRHLGASSAHDRDFELVRLLPALREWSAAEIGELSRVMRRRELPRGHVLTAEGATPGSLYLILRGALEVSTVRGGVKYRHGIRGPGRLAAQEAFVDGLPEVMDTVVRERSIVWELPRPTFLEMLAQQSPLAMKLLELICASLGLEFSADCRHFVRVMAENSEVIEASLADVRQASISKD